MKPIPKNKELNCFKPFEIKKFTKKIFFSSNKSTILLFVFCTKIIIFVILESLLAVVLF